MEKHQENVESRSKILKDFSVLLNNLVKKCLEALKFQGAWRFENGYFLKMGIANRPDP